MNRFFSVALATILAGSVAIGLPVIQSPTESVTNRVSLGAHVVLRVDATSAISPKLSYQWRFATGDIPDATNALLILDGVRTNQAGTYAASVSDADGTTTAPVWVVLIGPTFTKITNEPISKGSGAQGIALGDYNGDGWIDVFCAARSNPTTTLFLNKGDGSFVAAAGTIGAKLVNPIGATWGDYDNDGALDLFISNNNGGNDSLLRNNGEGFTAITKGSIVSSGGNGNGCGWGDYDRDGLLDLYVANSDGNNFLFHADTNGTFTRISTGPMVSGTGGSQGCAWIDYDNDGYPDLYVSGVPNLLFHNIGNGSFSKVPTASFAAGSGGLGFAWGDYDNDGWPDLLVANGGLVLYHNNGDGSFTKLKSPIGADSGSFATVNWIDYDNDGWLDIFATDFTAGAKCRLYHNNGDGTFTRVFGSPLLMDSGRWFAAAWGDINNDGFPDVLLSNINNPNVIHRNDGNDNHWLTVRCLGRVSNRSAIGAKVRIEATIFGRTFWQVREISSGGNIGDQNQMDPMFGLGDSAVVKQLVVEWPSGTRQELKDIAANQILTVREPARLGIISGAGAWLVNLRGGKNIVYDLEQSSDLQTWTQWTSITNNSGEMTLSDDANQNMRAYRALSDKTDQAAEGDDHALLAEYVDGSDTAFAALVRRHIDLVYSAALRQVRDPHTAADVTSAVFMVLSRKAGELTAGVVIAAWLHSTTRYAALKAIRARVRREHYEQEAARMQEIFQNEETSVAWEQIAPCLDESLSQLSSKDHEAIILRFFQNKSFPEIATVVGSTEEAVRKRVDRALQKLRQFLAYRGVIVSGEGFTAALVNAVRPSPPALAHAIRPFPNPSPGTTAPPLVLETLQALRWRFWKPILATGVAVLLASAPLALLLQNYTSGPLASPLSTFRLLNQAGNDGDGNRWSNLIHVRTPEEEQVRSVLTSNVVAQAGVRRALLQGFGQADYEGSAFPRIFDDTSETEIATAVQTVNGNEATLHFQRGSNLKFIRVRGDWKFDFFRTTSVRPEQLRQSVEANVPRLTTLESRVRAGEFLGSRAAAKDFQKGR